jgi:hypothetical protein
MIREGVSVKQNKFADGPERFGIAGLTTNQGVNEITYGNS